MVRKTQPNNWPFTLNEPVVNESSHLRGVPLTCNMFPLLFTHRERALGGWFCQLATTGLPCWACLMTNCMAELVGWLQWPQAWQNPPPRGPLSLSSISDVHPTNRIWRNKTFCWQKWFISKIIINCNVKFIAESALLFTIIQLQVSYLHIRLQEARVSGERYLFYSRNPNCFIGPIGALEKSLDPFWNVRFTLYTQ